MADPFTAMAIAGGVSAATGAAGTAMTAAGVGGGGTPQVKLPPELEAQQLQIIEQQIKDAQAASTRAGELSQMLGERASIVDGVANGFIPYSDGANAITQQNQLIAEKYGAETLNILGLEQTLRGKAEELATKTFEEFEDPRVEREIQNNQRLMEEQLTKDYGADWRNTEAGRRAMASFNESVSVMRTTASEQRRAEELNQLAGLTNVGLTLGENVFKGAAFGQNYLSANLASYSDIANQTAGISTDIAGKGLEFSNVPFSTLQQFGSQNLSGDIKDSIKSGAGGAIPEFQTYGEYKDRNFSGEDIYAGRQPSKEDYYSGYNFYG